MIKNEKQFKITNGWLKKFSKALKEVSQKEPDVDPLLIQVESNAIKSQINEFKKDIRDYNRLKNKKGARLESIYGIGEALIMARVMNNITQRQLADRLGMKEQQIQRYEETEYESAALHTIQQIGNELGLYSKRVTVFIKQQNSCAIT